jgi:hypothetical protein
MPITKATLLKAILSNIIFVSYVWKLMIIMIMNTVSTCIIIYTPRFVYVTVGYIKAV